MAVINRVAPPLSLFLLLLIFAACGKSGADVSEREYFLLNQSRCIVSASADIISKQRMRWPTFPASESEVSTALIEHSQEIRCGPQLTVLKEKNLVDSFGKPLRIIIQPDSIIIYSESVPFTLDGNEGLISGRRVTRDRTEEVKLDRSGRIF
ncbi:hypothetical protein [Nevskia ramosa]|uniref:hypothetical protein n=1 Tax=Nevskia ramosa TaxID=64002 RepID=UPI003D0D90A3